MFPTKKILGLAIATSALLGCGGEEGPQSVNFYNWSDYIAEGTLPNFTKETQIPVNYDVFDSNNTLEAKLAPGGSGFDLVVPSLSFLGRQAKAGLYQPIDKTKLKNYGNLDPQLMKAAQGMDPDNAYGIPYMWGTTGIGYNPAKVKEALGEDAPVDSWDLVFKPENLEKLKACGVAFLDEPDEMFAAMLNYLGKDPTSMDVNDYTGGDVIEQFRALRPHITYFHGSKYISDLASGDVCVAIGYSGDVMTAADRAASAKNGVEVLYSIPKEGAGLWFDMMAIPVDAPNVEGAYTLMDYLLRPEVAAENTNYVWYPNAVPASLELMDQEIAQDESIYPSEKVMGRLFTFKIMPKEIDQAMTRSWSKIKVGQ